MTEQAKKKTTKPSDKDSQAGRESTRPVSDEDLGKVGGGLSPQPLPPRQNPK